MDDRDREDLDRLTHIVQGFIRGVYGSRTSSFSTSLNEAIDDLVAKRGLKNIEEQGK